MIFKNLFKKSLFFLGLVTIVSCSTDDDVQQPDGEGTYSTSVAITDAPVDNPEVKAVFITIADVKVNGASIENFQKSTVEISSLTNGKTEVLGSLDLEEGTTSSIELILDNSSDASGNSPGNYVLTTGDEKKALTTSSNEIVINDEAQIEASNNNEIVLDFDLRKSIVADGSGNYSFVGNTELSNSIRAVNSSNTGVIKGTVSNNNDAKTIIAYAYKKGTYNSSETEATNGKARFSNAVSSSVVNKENGTFGIHFIENGDYELHLASFSHDNSDGRLSFDGELEATAASDLNLLNLSVQSNSEVSVEILLSGILGL